jgi:uroporphyrinogen-III decarboxylase
MTQDQWNQLLRIIDGEACRPIPVGFIIDSPWLPPWYGISTLDYYTSSALWLEANLKAVRQFPQVMFLPGFWSEYGMCTEPSAFGAKCVWHENDLPFAEKTINYDQPFGNLPKPDARTDGLLPLVLKRLVHARPRIEEAGHAIRFAVCRGPLNIASFLMGTTELMMGLKEKPEECHALLGTITDFLVDWLRLQKEELPTIGGIFALDDLMGFLGDADFVEFAKPYLKRVFAAFEAPVRFLHNDAHGLVCAPHLADIGINLFNFSFEHSLAQMRALAGNKVTLLGNIPPRDVLANGSPDAVRQAVAAALNSVSDHRRIILSAGGGLPPGVSAANIEAFLQAAGHTP